jgi:glycerol uptake facilitator-like aquaporin
MNAAQVVAARSIDHKGAIMNYGMTQRLAAECFGTALLVGTVVGSGIMGDRLANGNMALALLCNTIATAAILVTLIIVFGEISGAHFNPAVTVAVAVRKGILWAEVLPYVAVQIVGGIAGAFVAHVMFSLPVVSWSQHPRHGFALAVSEFVATFGLVCVIELCGKKRLEIIAISVGLYIAAAYWCTSSTSFANPAVTIARCFSDTFAGIRPSDVPMFVAVQIVGALTAGCFCRWILSGTTISPSTLTAIESQE